MSKHRRTEADDAPLAQPERKLPAGGPRRRSGGPRLDKVFPVILTGPRGIVFGIARNISEGGMFVEAVEGQPLGTGVQVTFVFPGSSAEISVEAEVRYTRTLNYTGRSGLPAATRGMGLKFTRFLPLDEFAQAGQAGPTGWLH